MPYNINSWITIVEYLMLEDIQEYVGLQEGIHIFFNAYTILITFKLKLNLLHLKKHSGYRQKKLDGGYESWDESSDGEPHIKYHCN